MYITNRNRVADLTANAITKCMLNNTPAVISLQGATYYFKPLTKSVWGLGSGVLELKFSKTENTSHIKEKLIDHFTDRFTEKVGYGGYDTYKMNEFKNINCDW